MEEEVESLPEALCYKQRLEKSTGAEMFLAKWSPVADLLAAACTDHSVVLNRLSWQRVWCIPPAESAVSALAWRPDGRVLAVGREDGLVCLHSVEDGHLLHEFSAGAAITQLQWTQQNEDSYKSAEYTKYEEQWKKYLPPLPALDSSQESFTSKSDGEGRHSSDPKQLFSHLKTVNLLLIGDEVGRIHFCVSGVLLAASAEVNSIQDGGHVIITNASEDFKLITCAMLMTQSPTEEQSTLCLQSLNTSLLTDRSHELQHLALKFGHISSLLEYMSSTLKSMHEAWEDLLLMMDSKLASYASTLPEGKTVSDEFLILLACGRARSELQTFLVDELTAKGVKKLGLSLEMSYTSIRKYVVNHLSGAIQSLHYHMTDVLGMARWTDRFGALGLSEAVIEESLNHVGTFALKSRELLLAIDDSLKSIKVFFIWLYGVILKLSGDPLPNGMKDHLTGEEIKLITDFLRKRLSKASEEDTQTFNLEVVGQVYRAYLEDQDLKYVEERPPSLLEAIIEDTKLDLKGIPWMFLPNRKKSLVQLFHTVHSSVDSVFATPMASIQQSFVSSIPTEVGPISCDGVPASHLTQWLRQLTDHFVHDGSHYVYHPTPALSSSRSPLLQTPTTSTAAASTKEVPTGCETISLTRYQDSNKPILRSSQFHVCNVHSIQDKDIEQRCQILSLQYYNEDALSILLHYSPKRDEEEVELAPGSTPLPHQAIAQLPIEGVVSLLPWDMVESHDPTESVDVGHILTQICPLGPFRAGKLAVSGTRKLAAVLTSNGKKIRLFDVDFEGEEED